MTCIIDIQTAKAILSSILYKYNGVKLDLPHSQRKCIFTVLLLVVAPGIFIGGAIAHGA